MIGSGFIGRLIERSDLRLFGIEESNRSHSAMENRIGVPSLGIAREGNCPLIMERDTVSNHIVKNRCLNAPWWHNASVGECESCWGRIS